MDDNDYFFIPWSTSNITDNPNKIIDALSKIETLEKIDYSFSVTDNFKLYDLFIFSFYYNTLDNEHKEMFEKNWT